MTSQRLHGVAKYSRELPTGFLIVSRLPHITRTVGTVSCVRAAAGEGRGEARGEATLHLSHDSKLYANISKRSLHAFFSCPADHNKIREYCQRQLVMGTCSSTSTEQKHCNPRPRVGVSPYRGGEKDQAIGRDH